VLNVAGKDQLLMTGCDKVSSFNPLNGETLWEVDGATTECVTSTVTDGSHIFTSGGYPKNHMSAVLADGSGKKVWETDSRLYVPSLLIRGGYLYGVLDAGIAVCWKADTGEEIWKARLGGTFSSSPVLVGDKIYATSEVGETFVFRADSTKFEQLAKCKLADEILSTLVICDSRIYYRAARLVDGKREEFLYCLGE
jgi:outer membrane protein assembly factor BamB